MITEKQAVTLKYFYDGLLRVTAISVDTETRNDEIQLANFGLTPERLADNNLPFRSKATVYFVDKRWSLIAAQKRFHKALQENNGNIADLLEGERKSLENLRSNFTKIGNTSAFARAGFEGQEAGLIAVVSLLEEIAQGKA